MLLAPLAFWVLMSGLDDLVLDLACFASWLSRRLSKTPRFQWPGEAELDAIPQKRIAIFVPLWREYRVIHNMIEHNVAANRYRNYEIFIGVYPNDGPTLAAVREVQSKHANVHLAVCPHDGPTSKADCLNWIYQRMLLFEEDGGARFETIMTHDAEDLIHPEALRFMNYFGRTNDMVQIPVLALPTPLWELTHGIYCDEFAEYQMKDMPARQLLGGFLPSNGVGSAFSRAALEKLAAAYSNCIFEPECLTEDYENGYRIHRLKCPQIFVPIRKFNGSFVATREYFPRNFKAAVRQRTRWVMGIALQSWERHGWREAPKQLYWFWRDRKALIGNLVAPLSNLLFLYGLVTWALSREMGRPWGLARASRSKFFLYIYLFTMLLQLLHMAVRAGCVCRIYGPMFALGVPIRAVWGNWINSLATVCAYWNYFGAKINGRPLVWLKTEHAYPSRAALMEHKRKLGEVLVGSQYISAGDLEEAVATKPARVRLGEHLVAMGKLTVDELYEALSLQQNLPLGRPAPSTISLHATRSLPARVARKWRLLPYKITAGHLYLAGPELPSEEMTAELREFSTLDIRFHLVTPAEFDELASKYLPESDFDVGLILQMHGVDEANARRG